MSDVIIEKLRFEELGQYKELIDNCFGSSMDIERYREMYHIDSNYEIITAKLEGKLIGSITLVKINLFTFSFQPMLELFNVCVDSEYRERKIGTLMMDHVVKFAKDNGYMSIILTCLEDLSVIHKFYEKVGFTKANSRKYVMNLSD